MTEPYYAVIFTNQLSRETEGYEDMAKNMMDLASEQPGFLGADSVRQDVGITISYWKDLNSIRNWRNQVDHLEAQNLGKAKWYAKYSIRIAKVEREYTFEKEGGA